MLGWRNIKWVIRTCWHCGRSFFVSHGNSRWLLRVVAAPRQSSYFHCRPGSGSPAAAANMWLCTPGLHRRHPRPWRVQFEETNLWNTNLSWVLRDPSNVKILMNQLEVEKVQRLECWHATKIQTSSGTFCWGWQDKHWDHLDTDSHMNWIHFGPEHLINILTYSDSNKHFLNQPTMSSTVVTCVWPLPHSLMHWYIPESDRFTLEILNEMIPFFSSGVMKPVR